MADDVLVIASKIRTHFKAAGLNTSAAVMTALSQKVSQLCDQAAANARADGRKTVLDRDVS